MISISVVVPVYSGQEYLHRLIDELEVVRNRWVHARVPMELKEVILVDDSAVDQSPGLIDDFARSKDWICAIHLSRNFGQHAATIAGILQSKGDWVITMDEDLQHPPSGIEALLRSAIHSDVDVVYAKSETAVHQAAIRDATSKIYKGLIRWLSGNKNAHLFGSFRLIRGSIARAASEACGHSTYFDMALSWFTQRVNIVPMTLKDDRYIQTGKSGYKISTLFSHARRMLISSQVKALRIGSLFGLFVLSLSVVGGALILLQKIFDPQAVLSAGWTSLMLTICFFSGAIVFILGIVLEYLTVLVLDSHGKPLFLVVDRTSDALLREYFSSYVSSADNADNASAGGSFL